MAVSTDEVSEIIVGGTSASTAAITFALTWADGVLDNAESLAGESYATADREVLQRLLAAHRVEREPVSQSVGQTSQRFSERAVGAGLTETKYGRDALAYDTLGVLGNVGLKVPTLEGYGTTYDASDPSV